MKYSNRLGQLRRAAGKTQAEVASDLDIKLSTLRNYEQGRVDLTGTQMILFADYYGCTTDEVVGHVRS